MIKAFFYLSAFIILFFCFQSCTYFNSEELYPETNFPAEIENILINKCATAGCHNNASSEAAGGLSLATWNSLFKGSSSGAVVIPYRADFSTLCYYTNTDTSKGLVLLPTMPYNSSPLSGTEYLTIKNWIQNGAPDKTGFIKFSDYQNKSKLYICNRGCDVVTVIDPETGLAMRYIDVGNTQDIESPCMIKVSPDKLHWYVIFSLGTTIQKYRSIDNVKVGEINIGSGIWSSLSITSDSKKAFITDANFDGRIIYADLENMQSLMSYENGLFVPANSCINNAGTNLYVTSLEGNFIYKINIANPHSPVIDTLSLEPGIQANTFPSINPISIIFNADESRYFVACNKSSEVRIFQTSNDSLLAIISTGSNPSEMLITHNSQYLLVCCLGVPGTAKKSLIYVYDANTGNYITEIYAGHDSKGMVIDETGEKLFVVNRNVSAGGPAAHHESVCAGKNGYLTYIDVNTLQINSEYKTELSVDPYFITK